MTFEEFFAKKKIDLEQLQKAEPDLYAEFRSHFSQMGEKSFDHTKKFWFNRLRHLYRLQEPVKEAVTQAETKMASQAESLGSPTIEQQATVPQEAPVPTPPVRKPAFKPRNIKPQPAPPPEDSQTTASRPGTTVPPAETGSDVSPAPAETPKPAYKPKFNLKSIPKSTAPATEQTETTSDNEKNSTDLPQDEESTEQTPAKPVYKPRFKMKNVMPPSPGADEGKTPSE